MLRVVSQLGFRGKLMGLTTLLMPRSGDDNDNDNDINDNDITRSKTLLGMTPSDICIQ